MLRSLVSSWPIVSRSRIALGVLVTGLTFGSSSAIGNTQIFESPHVHPIEMSPDGTRLFAVNTDDHRVSVFDLTQGGVDLLMEIPVGIEPVTVRARTNTEIWVVNHISDTISIIDLTTGNVVRTLTVGDEVTDVVFAGAPERAFVAVSQEDLVQVYDAVNPTTPINTIPLNGNDPRSLATNGTKVFVAIMDSGNNTTIVSRDTVAVDSLGLPPPNPPMNGGLPAPPPNGLIVRHNGTNWVDELSRSWDHRIPFTLYDNDVVEIDVATQTVTNAFQGVGTTLFNVAINPSTGRLYVSAQEATNEIRFEPVLNGQFAQVWLTTIDTGGPTVTPVHVNSHINYGVPAGDPVERSLSLGLLVDLAVSSNGADVYGAAFGSRKVGVFDANAAIQRRIPVGDGPTGVALDEPRTALYVLNRFDNTVSRVNLVDDSRVDYPLGFDVTPANIRSGRSLFYDTENSSAHGDLACASCHIWGGSDHLAWNLGDPTGSLTPIPPGNPASGTFHPMKGPMFTQSIKGLPGTEPLHWRGDRADLLSFNPAFLTIMGRSAMLDFADFQDMEDFLFSIQYPPTPGRNLDGSLPNPGTSPDPANGETLFNTGGLAGGGNCVDCHSIPTGTNQLIIPAGAVTEPVALKTPQLRNLYEKRGFDAMSPNVSRGFGFGNDAARRTLDEQLEHVAFTFPTQDDRDDVAAFMLMYDSGTPTALGTQYTFDGTNHAAGLTILSTLSTLADGDVIGLIAKGRDGAGDARGWTYQGSGNWISDRETDDVMTQTDILNIAGAGTEITFTAVTEACEFRLGVDRDGDSYRDRDELDFGTDPNDPLNNPAVTGTDPRVPTIAMPLEQAHPNPTSRATSIAYSLERIGAVRLDVFDVQGRLVRTLVDTPQEAAGRHERAWDLRDDSGRSVSPGMYFYKLQSPEGTFSRRLVVLR